MIQITIVDLEAEIAELNRVNSQLHIVGTVLEAENAALKDRIKHLQGALVTLNNKINELRDQNAKQEKATKELMAEVERALKVRR